MQDKSFSLTALPKRFMRSLVGKIIIIGFIILLLTIPYFMTVGLRADRVARSHRAENEVSSKWGGQQLVTAPVLEIPVQHTIEKNGKSDLIQSKWFILPEKLEVESRVVPEIRYRGIYQVMLYRAEIQLKAKFTGLPGVPPDNWKFVDGGQAKLLFSISDVKGIRKLEAEINGAKAKPMPGTILSFPIMLEKDKSELAFSSKLELNGCRQLLFAPIGRDFELAITSPWPHPSFTGGFLPGERKVSDSGFEAKWSVNELNSSFPSQWIGTINQNLPIGTHDTRRTLGVSFVQPAGPYQQVERVSDYAFLLIAIVLVAFLIGESVTKIWIHPIQYFFSGLSLVMFYMLLLALAEHVNFTLSYAVSTLVIAGMTTLYCRMIFAKKRSAALLLGGVMLLAYLLIFVLIRLEDYALLAGSGILLVLLGVLMRVTGNMNKEELAAGQNDSGTV